ncbi:MAG: hypothetical protein ACJAZ2_000807 [Glaciecola sp.]|jgi:hypothetical protein
MFKSIIQTHFLIFTFESKTKLIIKTMKKIFCYLFSLVIFSACNDDKLLDVVPDQKVEVQFKRFDHALFEQNVDQIESNLDSLAKIFPVFISGDYKNEHRVQGLVVYILNPLNQKLYLKSVKTHVNFEKTKQNISSCLNYYKHYFPKKITPVVYTYISGLNYEEPIIIQDSFALIGLDMFLGQTYEEYHTQNIPIPLFVSKKYDQKYLSTELMRNIATHQFGTELHGETLLEQMISLGKIEYFVHATSPASHDSIRFAFSPAQMDWCIEREWALWQHLTSKQLLFSKDYHEYKKYIEDQPFVSSLERESPGRAGVWIGFRIVSQYMNNNPEITLNELLTSVPAMEVFQGSKYKPKN